MDYEFITDIEGKIINLYCLDQELNSWIIVMILYFLIPNIEPQQSEFTIVILNENITVIFGSFLLIL